MRRVAALALTVLLAATMTQVAAAAASDSTSTVLDTFLHGLTTLRTSFTQTVIDSHGTTVESGAGTLLVSRPGRFRWDYAPKGAAGSDAAHSGQLLVADGKNLWFYDRELAQVSVKPVSAALSATPVILLSGTEAQLRDSFDVSAASAHDGMDWVAVKPRSTEADFSAAQLGFAHGELQRMIVNDRLGQTVQLDFSHSERNGRVDAQSLQFTVPVGVDVIGKPQS